MSINNTTFFNGLIPNFFSSEESQESSTFQNGLIITISIVALGLLLIANKHLNPRPVPIPEKARENLVEQTNEPEEQLAPALEESTPIAPALEKSTPKGFTPKGTRQPQNMTPKALAALKRKEAKAAKKAKRGKRNNQFGYFVGASLGKESNPSTPSSLASRPPSRSLSPTPAQNEHLNLGKLVALASSPEHEARAEFTPEPTKESLLGPVDWEIDVTPRNPIDKMRSRSAFVGSSPLDDLDSGVSTYSSGETALGFDESSEASISSTSSLKLRKGVTRPARQVEEKKKDSLARVKPPIPEPVDPFYAPVNPHVTFKFNWVRQYSHYHGIDEVTHDPSEGTDREVAELVRTACQFAYENYHDSSACRAFLTQLHQTPRQRIHVQKGLHQFKGPSKCHFTVCVGSPSNNPDSFHVNLQTRDDYSAKQHFSSTPLVGTEKWKVVSLTV